MRIHKFTNGRDTEFGLCIKRMIADTGAIFYCNRPFEDHAPTPAEVPDSLAAHMGGWIVPANPAPITSESKEAECPCGYGDKPFHEMPCPVVSLLPAPESKERTFATVGEMAEAWHVESAELIASSEASQRITGADLQTRVGPCAPESKTPSLPEAPCGCPNPWGDGTPIMHRPTCTRPAPSLPQCIGRYRVPHQRDEPFEVTYRCGRRTGHEGNHQADDGPVSSLPESGGAVATDLPSGYDVDEATEKLYVPRDPAEYASMFAELERIQDAQRKANLDNPAVRMVGALIACLKHRDSYIATMVKRFNAVMTPPGGEGTGICDCRDYPHREYCGDWAARVRNLEAALAAEQARNREMAATVEAWKEAARDHDRLNKQHVVMLNTVEAQRDKLLAQNAGLREALTISLAAMQANIAYATRKDEPALMRGIEAARAAILASQPEEVKS